MREDRGERPETKRWRGARPGRGSEGAKRRGCTDGAGWVAPPGSGVQRGRRALSGARLQSLSQVSVPVPVRGAREEASPRFLDPGSPGRRAGNRARSARRSGRAGAASSRPRWHLPGEPPAAPLPSIPGTWPEAGERGQAAAADDEVQREGAHAPAQAGQPGRQLLHGMGAPGSPSRGPDDRSGAARAPAPAATSWGRRGAPRLAARPGAAGVTWPASPRGAGPRHPPLAPPPGLQVPPPRPPGSLAPSPSVQVTGGDRRPQAGARRVIEDAKRHLRGRALLPRPACWDPRFPATSRASPSPQVPPGLRESPPRPAPGPGFAS